jgi:hypothetical protein
MNPEYLYPRKIFEQRDDPNEQTNKNKAKTKHGNNDKKRSLNLRYQMVIRSRKSKKCKQYNGQKTKEPKQ